MNRDIEHIREVMRRRNINQKQMAEMLAKVTGKKTGRAAVSRQLNQPRMSATMLMAYRKALDVDEPDAPRSVSLGGDEMGHAVRLLMRCSPVQLARVVAYITGLLEST